MARNLAYRNQAHQPDFLPPTGPTLGPSMTTPRKYHLGHLPIELHGEDPFADALDEELISVADPAPLPEKAERRLIIRSKTALPALSDPVLLKPIKVDASAFRHSAGRCAYQAARNGNDLQVDVCAETPGPLRHFIPVPIQRAMNYNHLGFWERRIKSFIYDAFDYLAQAAQLPLGQTFIHASSLERDGNAVALLAWGGIGKTTSMLKLVLEDGWRFLSDDLGLLDKEGILHRSPKKLQVYGYNLVGQDQIRSHFLAGRTMLDRLSWEFFHLMKGKNKVRRRVSAESLFGSAKVAQSGRLQRAIFLERVLGEQFATREASPQELANRCAAILIRELSPFPLISSVVHAAGTSGLIPSIGEMEDQIRSILVPAFSRVPCFLVRIPIKAGPNELVSHLRPLVG